MATGSINGMRPGKRKSRETPSRLDLGNASITTPLVSPAYVHGITTRQPHDSVLDPGSSRSSSALKSPFQNTNYDEFRDSSPWFDDDVSEVEDYATGGRTPISMLPPPRKESLHSTNAATSPLARTVDDEYLTATGSPPLKASAFSSPNVGQEQWWRSESRPGSAQPSPRFARAMDQRSSAASAMLPSPGFAGVSNARLRGMTASSSHSPGMHHSASYTDLRMSNRTLPTNVYRPSRRPDGVRDSAQSTLRHERFVPPFAEEARASIRSAWTAHSSGFLGSDRSSVMTRASSTSELRRMDDRIDDLLLSVEDAINMYSMGFADDAPDNEDSTDDGPTPSQERRSFSELHGSRALQHSTTFDESSTAGVERAPMLPRSSSDPDSERLVKSPGQHDYANRESSASEHLITTHVYDVYEGKMQSKTGGQTYELDGFPYQQQDSGMLHELPGDVGNVYHELPTDTPPSFRTSPTGTTLSPSQPRTPTSRDDVFSPRTARHRPPVPPDPDSGPRPYLPLPNSPDQQQRNVSRSADREFVNPRAPPELPPPPVARDRYGFKKVTQYINVEQYDQWDEVYTPYLARRRVKWELLMKQFGLSTEDPVRFPPKTEKVKRYIRKGIPPEWRGAAWFWYAGGPGRLTQNSGLYWTLIEQLQQGKLSDSDREHIERDLNRTFPDNVKFKPDASRRKTSKDPGQTENGDPPDTPIIGSLRRVLQAFALHNTSIGYCQSLNFLAGLLLLFLDEDEEKAFIMLDVITSEHLPGTHAKVLEANVDIGVLMLCIKESMPAVWAKIDDNAEEMIPKTRNDGNASISRLPTVSLATTAWFMSCFIGNLPIECVLRVWDIFFFEGSKTLFRIALTIFKLGEPEIRSITEHMEIFQLVQTIPRRLIDANLLMEACYKKRNGFQYLSQDTVDQRRVERRKILADERARKLGSKNAKPSADGSGITEDDARGRLDVASSLKRAASRARMKRAQSRRRPPTARG